MSRSCSAIGSRRISVDRHPDRLAVAGTHSLSSRWTTYGSAESGARSDSVARRTFSRGVQAKTIVGCGSRRPALRTPGEVVVGDRTRKRGSPTLRIVVRVADPGQRHVPAELGQLVAEVKGLDRAVDVERAEVDEQEPRGLRSGAAHATLRSRRPKRGRRAVEAGVEEGVARARAASIPAIDEERPVDDVQRLPPGGRRLVTMTVAGRPT